MILDTITINKCIRIHLMNIFNFYKLYGKIIYKNDYLDRIFIPDNYMDFIKEFPDINYEELYFIFKKYDNFSPNDGETLDFIKSPYGKTILVELLDEDNYNDMVNSIELGENIMKEQEKTKIDPFDELYG